MAEHHDVMITPLSLPEDWPNLHLLPQHGAATSYSSGHESCYQIYGSVHPTPYDSPVPGHCGPDFIRSQSDLVPRYEWQSSAEHYFPPHISEVYPLPSGNTSELSYMDGYGMADTHVTPSPRQTTSSPSPYKPATRSKQKSSNSKANTLNLTEPLSALTKDSAVPLKDMHAFVHRSKEERVKEKDRKNGYIVRPMNAFMLYRSAYAERAKSLFEQNNHQIVSKATGQSWRMETKEIQDYYKHLSDVERENHQKAWPEYKFTPSKPLTAARKRKGASVDTDEEEGEQDVSDYDWTPSGSRRPRPNRSTSRKGTRLAEVQHSFAEPMPRGHVSKDSRSSFHFSNPGRSAPVPIHLLESLDAGPHYYSQEVRDHQQGPPFVEDVRFQREPYPGAYLEGVRHGVPSGAAHEIYDFDLPEALNEHPLVLDPSLGLESQPVLGAFTEQSFHDFDGDMLGQHTTGKDENSSKLIGGETGANGEAYLGEDRFEQWINDTNSGLMEG